MESKRGPFNVTAHDDFFESQSRIIDSVYPSVSPPANGGRPANYRRSILLSIAWALVPDPPPDRISDISSIQLGRLHL